MRSRSFCAWLLLIWGGLIVPLSLARAEKSASAAAKPTKAAAPAGGKVEKSLTKGKPAESKKKSVPTSQPAMVRHLELLEVDLNKKRAQVRLEGIARTPQSKQFVFTNERGYHYIAMNAWCSAEAGSKSPSWNCALELPSGYEHSSLVSLVFRAGGASVEAKPDEVKTIWSKAQEAAQTSAEDKN